MRRLGVNLFGVNWKVYYDSSTESGCTDARAHRRTTVEGDVLLFQVSLASTDQQLETILVGCNSQTDQLATTLRRIRFKW